MKINSLRASTIGTYKDCEWKFYLEQQIGMESKAGKKAMLGTIIHHILELLAKAKKTGHYVLYDKYTDIDYLIKICWDRYYRQYNDTFKFDNKDLKFVRDLTYRVINSKWNPLNFNILATEKQFEIDIQKIGFEYKYTSFLTTCLEQGYMKLRGTMDLITLENPDTLHLLDWKSGECKNWVTGEKKQLEDFHWDIQLRVYDLALSIIYPQYKYRMFTVFYIRDGGPFTVAFDDNDRDISIDIIRRYFNNINSNFNPTRIKDDPTRRKELFKCNKVCNFGKTLDLDTGKSLCDKYHAIFKQSTFDISSKKIYDLTVGGQNIDKSRRNDYSRAKISKGLIC